MTWLKSLYRTYIFDPLAGGNGKIQMEEIARAVLLVMICRASFREGEGPEQLYPDIYWMSIFASVCAIAGFKRLFSKKDANQENH